ncbi:hypothetical protein BGX26_010849 [Mortierella sp. AD094]|nr:hypothetical protein BGX26_010849 [Mortierella sp. AD094]
MAIDHSTLTSTAFPTMHEQQQTESRKKGAQFKGTLNTSIVQNNAAPTQSHTITSTSPSKELNSNSNSRPSTPSTSSKPLVFKKPTKHQFSWSELTKMIASKDLTPMGRSEQVQEAYQRAIKRRTKKYGSADEYIRQRVLHWPPAERDAETSDGNESSSSCSSASPPSSPTGPVDPLEVRLKKNEFPYSVKPGIEHWLIWSRNLLTDEDWIRAYLTERLPGRDFLFFINPPELRSVPTIFHVQVFTKGEGEVLDEEDIEIKKEEQAATASKSDKLN